MRHILSCVLLLGASLSAQTLQSTLLALKDPRAPRKVLSDQLVDEMMAMAKSGQSPARTTVQRFAEDLTGALLGKDITAVRATALAESHHRPDERQRFDGPSRQPSVRNPVRLPDGAPDHPVAGRSLHREIGQEIRGPDDSPLIRDITRK